jgi:hypothetical protein
MIHKQQDDGPHSRDQDTVQVETSHSGVANGPKQPSTDERANNPQQHI